METKLNEEVFLWQRVQAALDRREDPLADPELALELAQQPDLLLRVGQLLENLEQLSPEALPALPVPRSRPSRGRVVIQLAGAAAVVMMAYGVWRNSSREPSGSPQTAVERELPLLALRHAATPFRVVIQHTSAAGTKRVSITQDTLTTEFQPIPVDPSLPDDLQPDRGWRLTAGDSLIYESITALLANE